MLCSIHKNGHVPHEDIKLQKAQKFTTRTEELQPLLPHTDAGAAGAGDANADQITLEVFILVLLRVVAKISRHDTKQIFWKLASGAAGWLLAELLFENDLASWPLYLAEGGLATTGVFVGMLTSQALLGQNGGHPAGALLRVALELVISVTIADGLWQPAANIVAELVNSDDFDNEALLTLARIIPYYVMFLLPAIVFSLLQNTANLISRKTNCLATIGGIAQQEFAPDANFTAIVAITYFAFALLPELAMTLFSLLIRSKVLYALKVPITGLSTGLAPLLACLQLEYNATQEIRSTYAQLKEATAAIDGEDLVETDEQQKEIFGNPAMKTAGRVTGCTYALWKKPAEWAHYVGSKMTQALNLTN